MIREESSVLRLSYSEIQEVMEDGLLSNLAKMKEKEVGLPKKIEGFRKPRDGHIYVPSKGRYQLTLIEPQGDRTERAIGENIFIDHLGSAYKVYVFYYPGAMPDEGLEQGLRTLGEVAGENLFVNIGKLSDPKFDEIVKKFGIKKLPAIIVTGVEG